MRWIAAALVFVACQRGGDDPAPGGDVSAIVGSAYRVAFGPHGELVLADANELRVVDPSGKVIASTHVTGGCQVLVTDGDRILTGWGQSREHRNAPAKVTIYRVQGDQLVAEDVLAPLTPRPEIVAIIPEPEDLFVAYFDSKYTVKSVRIRDRQVTDVATIRMATSYARTDAGELAVGRVYGDDKGADGDAFILHADGTRTAIPTLRGVRSIAAAGGDIFLGDGWHQNYAQQARGRFVRVHDGAAQLIEDIAGQFSVERILPTTVNGHLVLVTMGNRYVRAFVQTGALWKGVTLGGANARDIAVRGDQVLIAGDKSALVRLTW